MAMFWFDTKGKSLLERLKLENSVNKNNICRMRTILAVLILAKSQIGLKHLKSAYQQYRYRRFYHFSRFSIK